MRCPAPRTLRLRGATCFTALLPLFSHRPQKYHCAVATPCFSHSRVVCSGALRCPHARLHVPRVPLPALGPDGQGTEPWYRLGGIFRTRWPARAVVPPRWYKSYTIPPRWYNCFFPLSPPPSCVLALYHCACQTRQYVCSYVRMPFLQHVRASIYPLLILCTLWRCTHPLYSHLFFLRSGACPAARLPRAFVHIVSISPVRPLHTSLLPPASLTGRCLHNIL